MRDARVWTTEEKQKLRAMWFRHDLKQSAIAAEFGVARSTLGRVADAMGLPRRDRSDSLTPEQMVEVDRLINQGQSFRAIERATGICAKTARRYLVGKTVIKPRGPWTLVETALFYEKWNEALSPTENAEIISALIGRHPEGVLSKAKMVGLFGKTTLDDPYQPTQGDAKKHVEACLAEGGFPWREVINGRTVEFRPARLEAEAA